jgi:metacaspase-1
VQTRERLLVEQAGFSPHNIKKLFDSQATRKNIEELIRTHLVQASKDGDEIVFFMSSHGTQIKDLDGDEDDGLDEALVTYDTDPKTLSNLFVDDDLGALLAQSRASRSLVIIDTCHSGTMTKGVTRSEICGSESARRNIEEHGRHLDLYCESEHEDIRPVQSRSLASGRNLMAVPPLDVGNAVIMISAAEPQQVAMPIRVDGRWHGAFTYYFDQGIRGAADANGDGKVSFAELKSYVDKSLTAHPRVEQKVYFGASSPHDPVFATGPTSAWSGMDQGVGAFRVALNASQGTVRPGDTLRFSIETERPGYLLLFERSPQGRLRVLVPNAYQESVGPLRLAAGRTAVPAETDFWSLEAAGPAGAWEYKAIVSEQPLSADQLVSIDQGYLQAEGSAAASLLGTVRNLVAVPPADAQSSAPPKYAIAAATVHVQ